MPGRPIQRHASSAKLVVRALNAAAQRGYLAFGPYRLPCVLGHAGVKVLKREGDLATPRGRFRLRGVFYNPERVSRPQTMLPIRSTRRTDAWCDSPSDRNYNRFVSLPYPGRVERLWRDDGLYDIFIVLGYNDVPRVRNRGSAIFMHLVRPDFRPTEGCIALRATDMKRLLRAVSRRSDVIIEI
jgi:L,D-peptidoglycan transpeptidase YkuD (ErfK/YbiS/YcfS/YnhG family)